MEQTAFGPRLSMLLDRNSLGKPNDSPEFLQLQESNTCPQCKNVLRNAVQLICGHNVCQHCLAPLFAEDEVKLCTFDDCGLQISRSQVFPDPCRRREVLKEKVYCTFKTAGCEAVVAWKDLVDHIQRCEFAVHPCVRAAEGCTAVLPKKIFEKHVNEECDYLPVKCNNCGYQTTRGRFRVHIENDCPKTLIDCPYQCGAAGFPRGDLDVHTEAYVNKPTVCSFNVIGCDFKGPKIQVENHEKEDHSELLWNYIKAMEDRNKQAEKELETSVKEHDKLKEKLKTLQNTYSELNELMDACRRGERDLKQTRVAPESVLREVASTITQNNDQQTEAVLENLQNQVASHGNHLAELNLRLQMLETASYDGNLLWKIDDYQRRRQEAISESVSIFSPPFYTSPHGYKLCCKLYLNGDGIGKNTHLSLFLIIMKGEYDAVLPWPFSRPVSVALKDQDNRTRDIQVTINPNVLGDQFRRPTSEVNVASGIPTFAAISELETPTYLRDNTIFVEIKVNNEADEMGDMNQDRKEVTAVQESGQELERGSIMSERTSFQAGEGDVSASNLKLKIQNRVNFITDTESRIENFVAKSSYNVQCYSAPSQINNLERQLTLHDIRLAEMDLRFQILETANYDGVLMWKIRDYARRRQEATSGRTLSLYSQPFYTARPGYKMCGRIYLNGDGIGKNTHLSFFFVLMKGDYDSVLPWPFRQRVSLLLKDQNKPPRDLCDTFTPNPSSNSFARPTTEMNVASGVPKFISHQMLETSTYLQDDTIYLMIKVDTGNLPDHPNA